MVKSTGNNSQQGSDQVLLLHIHQNIFFFFKISSFVFRRKKFIPIWNNLRVSKWWQNCLEVKTFHWEKKILSKIIIINHNANILNLTENNFLSHDCRYEWCIWELTKRFQSKSKLTWSTRSSDWGQQCLAVYKKPLPKLI